MRSAPAPSRPSVPDATFPAAPHPHSRMRLRLSAPLGALLTGLGLLAPGHPSAVSAQGRDTVVAFTDVTVVPMDRERTIAGQTVIVRGGKIAEMGPSARVRVPAGAVRVEGRGRFLMPGLAEMHAHVYGPNAPAQLTEELLTLYIANGITTIRGMLGAPSQFDLRRRTASGELLGPTMLVAAPSLNGRSAPTPDSAAKLIRLHKAAGYDLLKLHPGLSRATFDTIMAVSAREGITVGGHVSADVGLLRALEARQHTIDHLDGYFDALVPEAQRVGPWVGGIAPTGAVVPLADTTRIPELVRRTKAAGIYIVPTEFLWENFALPGDPAQMAAFPEMKYVPKTMVDGWVKQKQDALRQTEGTGLTPELAKRFIDIRRRLFDDLADAGVPMLMGTDSPQMFNVPGFALHRELKVMKEAGLTNWQILVSGTRNVGDYVRTVLKGDGAFGTVAKGQRADLVLLDANPLAELSTIERPSGVMVRGRWLDRAEIDRRLAEIAARHAR